MELPPIISLDDHVMEPPDLFQRRLPAKLRDRGPKVVRLPWQWGEGRRQPFVPATSGPETDFWVMGDLYQGIQKGTVCIGMSAAELDDAPMNFADIHPGCYEVKARLADMDRVGIERSLCFP